MSSTTLPVCPKTGSTSPSLTVHLCLHTAPGNRECAHREWIENNRKLERLVKDMRHVSSHVLALITGREVP